MTEDPQFVSSTHASAIDVAIKELHALESRTRAPAPLPHQFIGTIVDNSISFLTTAANALDGGIRSVAFSESHNWVSLMTGVHRCFFLSVHTAAEVGLIKLCEERRVKVISSVGASTERSILKIEQELEQELASRPIARRSIKKLRDRIRRTRPAFDDYLKAALSTVKLTEETQKLWCRFFRALSIVRNKTSHAVTTLTDNERDDLRAGGFSEMLSAEGELAANTRMHRPVAASVLDFFDDLYREANVIKLDAS